MAPTEGEKKGPSGIGHIKRELSLRLPHYKSDWTEGFSFKVAGATCYMFFASVLPVVTLGAYLLLVVEGQMGPIEALLSTALCGVVFSIIGGQGMVIMGVTGPVCIFCSTCYTLSVSLRLPFLPWMAWIGIWSCLMHVTLALAGACRLVCWVTRFACESFGSLIGIIYVWTAMEDLKRFFDEEERSSALMSLILCLGTHSLATSLINARGWTLFTKGVRETIASYAVAVTIVLATIVSVLVKDNLEVDVPRIKVPEGFQPTIQGRPWLVDITACPTNGIVTAIVPALVLTVLFFFDHNVSSLMAQAPEFNLRKPPAYNWDFLIVGLLVLVCGMLGLPFANGLIPQAPLHVHALCQIFEKREYDGTVQLVIADVKEQRLSNFVQSLAIGLCCTAPALKILGMVPLSVLSGLFLFMGMGCFEGNGFVHRLLLPFEDPTCRSAEAYSDLEPLLATPVGKKEVMGFTSLQLLCWILIFGVTKTPAAIAFPLLIAALVAVRWKVLPKLFSAEAIKAMDGEEAKDSIEGHEEDGVWEGPGCQRKSICLDAARGSAMPTFCNFHATQQARADNDALRRLTCQAAPRTLETE